MELLKNFWRDEQGTETVEWAIVIGMIAVAAITTVMLIGNKVTNAFKYLNNGMSASFYSGS